jgi:FMN phosphatase YigB (HAD superfamily)
MFDSDRFNESQDYEKTYSNLGGAILTNRELHEYINFIYSSLLTRSREKKFIDDMITVDEFIRTDNYFSKLKNDDKVLLEQVFANHERGVVPVSCKQTLEKLSATHKLGLISNVWCNSSYFREQLKKDNVHDLFDLLIFSSDHKSVKPSKKLFDIAAAHFVKLPEEIVYIGDNYKRDVIGSKNAGMRSILVNNSVSGRITGEVKPDHIINRIEELV